MVQIQLLTIREKKKEDLDENETDNYDHKGGSKYSSSVKDGIHSQFLPSQKVFKKVSALSERLLSFPALTIRDCNK